LALVPKTKKVDNLGHEQDFLFIYLAKPSCRLVFRSICILRAENENENDYHLFSLSWLKPSCPEPTSCGSS